MLPQKPHSLSDIAAEHASAEATFAFICRSRARFRRSHNFFQMLQHSPLPQKPHCLSDATAEPASDAPAERASTEATFSFRCHSSARSRRNLILFSDDTVVPVSAETSFFFQMSQQCPFPQKPYSLFRCYSSAHFCRCHILFPNAAEMPASAEDPFLFSDAAAVPLQQAVSSIVSAISYANVGGWTSPALAAVLRLIAFLGSILGPG